MTQVREYNKGHYIYICLRFCLLVTEDHDPTVAQDQIVVFRPPSPTLGKALITYASNFSSNTVQQQRTDQYCLILIKNYSNFIF